MCLVEVLDNVTIVFSLHDDELERLKQAIKAYLSIPFSGDVRGPTWEAIFHYVKGIPIPDVVNDGETKNLFDATQGQVGWSLKTLLLKTNDLTSVKEFELVIQRADILKKYSLTINEQEQVLGEALIDHWNNNFDRSAEAKGVTESRIAFLLKNQSRTQFLYFEQSYPKLDPRAFTWRWTDEQKLGLQGYENGQLRLRWYRAEAAIRAF